MKRMKLFWIITLLLVLVFCAVSFYYYEFVNPPEDNPYYDEPVQVE